jgi:hypothetical protein
VGLLAAIGFVVAYSFGLVISGGKGYSSGGYRDLSMNLLAPFDPRTWTSVIFPRLHSASTGQYEGYNYLGAGVLILAAVVVIAAIIQRGKLWRPDKRWLVPLAISCLLLTLLALSTKITFGSTTVVDLDPGGRIVSLFFAAAGQRTAVLGALLRDPGRDPRRAISAVPQGMGESADRRSAGSAVRRHQRAAALGAYDHQRRSSVAVAVAHLVAVGSAASEPDCAAGVAM